MASLACSAGRNASLVDACIRPALAVALGGRGRQARGRGAGGADDAGWGEKFRYLILNSHASRNLTLN